MSKSQTRQRSRMVNVSLTDAERAKVEADAEAAGLSLSGYARQVVMSAPTPRTKRRAAPDLKQLNLLSAALGKIGGNLNQLAKLANQGRIPHNPDLERVRDEVRALTNRLDRLIDGDC